VEQPRDEATGDYEYDEAHDRAVTGPVGHPEAGRPAPVPAGRRRPEPDGDMTYDEAHGF